MRNRILLGALGAVVAAVVGLGLSAGVASASAPSAFGHNGGPDITCTSATSCTYVGGGAIPTGTTYTPCTIATGSTSCVGDLNGTTDPAHPGLPGGVGGNFYPGYNGGLGGAYLGGGYFGGSYNGLNLINGNLLALNGLQVNVCTVPNYSLFVNQYGGHLGSLAAQLNALRYQQLLAQAGCGSNTIVNGVNGLALVNGQFLNLSNYGLNGTLSVCAYPNYNALNTWGVNAFGGRFGTFTSRFGANPFSVYNQLRAQANCSAVVVTPAALSTPAPAASGLAPAADPSSSNGNPTSLGSGGPTSGSGVVDSAPKGAPATGDGSLFSLVG